jgi:hypothetical protein
MAAKCGWVISSPNLDFALLRLIKIRKEPTDSDTCTRQICCGSFRAPVELEIEYRNYATGDPALACGAPQRFNSPEKAIA